MLLGKHKPEFEHERQIERSDETFFPKNSTIFEYFHVEDEIIIVFDDEAVFL